LHQSLDRFAGLQEARPYFSWNFRLSSIWVKRLLGDQTSNTTCGKTLPSSHTGIAAAVDLRPPERDIHVRGVPVLHVQVRVQQDDPVELPVLSDMGNPSSSG
jgi:hypothetical protein